MVIAAAVIPQTVALVVGQDVVPLHVGHHTVDAVGQTQSFAVGHVAGQCWLRLVGQEVRPCLAAPPRGIVFAARGYLTSAQQPSMLDREESLFLVLCTYSFALGNL